MLKNYFKIALRNLQKNKLHAAINIFGLAMGFVVAILSIIYINNELSYDTWLSDSDRIYRAYRQGMKDPEAGWTYTPKRLGPYLQEEVSGVEKATRVYEHAKILLTHLDKSLYVERAATTDSLFFEVFQFPFLHGDPGSVLDEPNSIVISQKISERFFGNSNPVGQTISLDGETDYQVKGVLQSLERDTYLDYEIYIPFYQTWMENWLANNVSTYILRAKNADIQQVSEATDRALFPIYKREMNAINMSVETMDDLSKWKFQPLANIHLLSGKIAGVRASEGNLQKLYLFGFIAFIVLLIAIINYLNLATAKAANRAKEVGMRKVAGAQKGQLIFQFLTESVLQSIIALSLGLVLAEFLIPVFNQITDRELTFLSGSFSWIILPMLLLGLLIGILAGLYPAFYLSGFQPVKVLKGKVLKLKGGQSFRKGLVIAQFTMTVVLMIVLAFVYKQITFMQDQDLGFNGEKVLTVEINMVGIDNYFKFILKLKYHKVNNWKAF